MRRVCANGHTFEKSSDCPTCPVCEKAKEANAYFHGIGAPAQRALANAGITTIADLNKWRDADLLALHGMGPKAMLVLKKLLMQKTAKARGAANTVKGKSQRSPQPKTLSVTAYLAAVPQPMRKVLTALRATIRTAAPKAEEKISYGIPTYVLHGPIIHWAAFKNHASLIGVDKDLLRTFATELAGFKTSGSTIHFTWDKPLPSKLVKKIVGYRVRQNLQRQELKKRAKPAKKK